jgi:hypothetical protein
MAKILKFKKDVPCQYPGCDQVSTELVYQPLDETFLQCCEKHGDKIIEDSIPFSHASCPNCGCHFPIG